MPANKERETHGISFKKNVRSNNKFSLEDVYKEISGFEIVSHQRNVPVSRTQHFEDHFDLLEGCVPYILIIVTSHLQSA